MVYYELSEFRPPTANRKIGFPSYTGQVTYGAKKRIQKAIDIFLQKAPQRIIYNPVTGYNQPFQLNFVTLTVSSHKNIDINEGYKNLMKPFLRKLRATGPLSYIWKAEFQERGQLHYHVTTNTFIHWSTLRNTWNNLQRKHRYLDDFASKTGHFDANSTDVHAVYKINDLASYLSKYMSKPVYDQSKKDQKGKPLLANGKIWDCSTDLKQQRFSFELTNHTELALKEAVKRKEVTIVPLEYCTIFKTKKPLDFLDSSTLKNYLSWKY